jgi:hypothetical protein
MAGIEDRAMLIELNDRAQKNELELIIEYFVDTSIVSDYR